MEIYTRKSKFSEINTFNKDCLMSDYLKDKLPNMKIISIAIDEKIAILEYVPNALWDLYCGEKAEIQQKEEKKKLNEELENALDTTLNTDPFGGVHSGKKLGEIYKNDRKWFDKALKELRNQFILDRIKIILKELEG